MDFKPFVGLDNEKFEQNYSRQTWEYLKQIGLRQDPTRDALEQESRELFGSKANMVTQRQECQLFELILRFAGAKNCIEIGVFTGSSSISIARAIGPQGRLIAIDVNEAFTNVAKKYWKQEGLEDRIELVLRPAVEYLEELLSQGKENFFDFAYIDADKINYQRYYDLLIRLVRPGGIIAIDNVLWYGSVPDVNVLWYGSVPDVNDSSPEALLIRALNLAMQSDPRVNNFILPIADGINLVYKN
ncbi:hypothetical protein SteCoe_3485 [Stentor coeruleus]|uniref:Caffeoyl-CoA O-methyltransferase n=1 Tax=Stentor coeruleus TaxID=5963 RepID=A0A1R2CX05_9CILI|nr:hypothetical protein SteCoe_3485 [Stentor coeruleus]